MAPKKRTFTTVPTVEIETPQVSSDLVNHFVFVLDRSGSMGMIAPNAIRSHNDNIDAVRAAVKTYGQQTTVRLITFASDVQVGPVLPVEAARPLTADLYRTGGGTALFDAVGEAITLCMRRADANDPNVSFVILVTTDGEENCSTHYCEGSGWNVRAKPSIVELMRVVQATDRYTIAFLVPPGKGRLFADRYGIPYGNVREWEATARGVQEATRATVTGTASFFQDRSIGLKSKRDYYAPDLSNLTQTDLSKMDDLSGNFRKWTVDKEEDITAFVERHGVAFVLGAGYYPVTKKELLRTGRNVMVREKTTKRIYGGAQARQILGLPTGEAWITPGNHANFDVFFQSTSRNRKLVRGTELLWDKTKVSDSVETWDSAGAKAAADLKKAQQTGQPVVTATQSFIPPGSTIKL